MTILAILTLINLIFVAASFQTEVGDDSSS